MLRLAVALAWGAGDAVAGEDTVFLEDIADLPLAPGLTEEENAGLVFDKPDGRIVKAVAAGPAARRAVAAFYGDVLPALGWRLVRQSELDGDTELIFDREDERIKIVVAGDGTRSTVRFELSPK